MRRLIFALSLVVLVGSAGLAHAGPMVLTSDGHLYKVWVADEGLVLSHSGPGIDAEDTLVPQTAGLGLDGVVLVIDEATTTPFILWTDALDGLSSVRLAALVDEAWFGPVVLGGEDGTSITNPDALLHTVRTVIETDDMEPEVLETTFLHTVWWRHDNVTSLGHAVYLPIPLDIDGFPLLNDAQAFELENLLPFGFGCDDNPDVTGLTSARFFIGDGGLPQLFTPDFADCLFQLLGIDYEIEETEMADGTKRRRQIAVFNTGEVMMAIPPDINLQASKMFLGHDNSVLIYWDAEDSVEWILSDTEGWTTINTLPLGDDINHEQAVELLRKLAP